MCDSVAGKRVEYRCSFGKYKLEDEYFLRAKRIEIPASITGCTFYQKMGYNYKNGIAEIDEEELYRLEKFREV